MRLKLLLLFCINSFICFSSEEPKNEYASHFSQAYNLYPEIPKGLLEAVAFSYTQMQHITHTNNEPESCTGIPNVYGVMGLTLDGKNYFKNNLVLVSKISNYSVEEIIQSPEKNIIAYAKAFSITKKQLNITSNKPEDNIAVLISLSELPSETITQNFALNSQLYLIYNFLNDTNNQIQYNFPDYNIDFISIFGKENYSVLSSSKVIISNDEIKNTRGNSYQNTSVQSVDYPPALWNAAAACNYTSRNGTAITAVAIHTAQGTYAGTIAWFKDCSVIKSAHYVIRSSDGQVTQMVLEADKAWHLKSESSYTIGIEHEGYINNAAWYTNAMYVSSANLVRDITQSGYGINPLRTYFGPGCTGSTAQCYVGACTKIKGHQMFPNQTHTDPGPNWNWALYYLLINNNPAINTITTASGNFYDSGGANANYTNDERTLTLIKPLNASSVTLNFSSFTIENNYDYLFIYDGTSTAAPLIGQYTGINSPGIVTSSTGALLIEFRSDCATSAAGWNASWTSNIISQTPVDSIIPSTFITPPNAWETQNFSISFNDTDNIGGSGVNEKFYTINDYNTTEWRANNTNGFFYDAFDSVIHSDWNTSTGNWAINNKSLYQSDENLSNTNIYSLLNQNTTNSYLYNFHAKIDGTGNSKRAGFHFMCDNGGLSNRGNSYLIWIEADAAKLRIYKTTNNVIPPPVIDTNYSTTAGKWYDYKIIYNKTSGKISFYRDNELITSWMDSSPLTSGNAISFRSGTANFTIDELKVYKSRTTLTTVSVGASNNNDIRYQNPNPLTASAKIKSICTDSAGNLSAVYTKDINIDWTPPTLADTLNDSLGTDISITTSPNILAANWSSSTDTNSAIARYWYAIGTSSGATDILNWTDNWFNLFSIDTLSNLVNGQTYYYSVKAENGAGLQSAIVSSNGQTLQLPSSINESENNSQLMVYPNPFSNQTTVSYFLEESDFIRITLNDVLGKEVLLINEKQNKGINKLIIDAHSLQLSPGIYLLSIKGFHRSNAIKLLIK